LTALVLPEALAVFEHEKRHDWGLGILAWEGTQKRGYVFENGQLRILAREFYALMREVDRPADEIRALYDALKPELEAARKSAGVDCRPVRVAPHSISFDDQLALFRREHPDGFEGGAWLESQRGKNARKRLPRHRDAAIAQAAATLGRAELLAHIAHGDSPVVLEAAFTLLRKSDLVGAAELAGSDRIEPEDARHVATALVALLYPQSSGYSALFDRFVAELSRSLRRPAGWQLVTALPALLRPNDHVCVRPGSFREQAKWMAPRLVLPKLPSGSSYERCRAMAELVATRLREQGERPQDLMDVHDFIRVTTGPGAKRLLGELKHARHRELAAR
jgi:hypothetical protein